MKKTAQLITVSFLSLAPITVQAQADLEAITITENVQGSALDATGFSELPAREVPVSGRQFSATEIQENRIHRLSDITFVDASVTDSYNAAGYWDFLSVRGFILDNRFNFQREGLPINAQTSIPLDNKERIELLKGLNGVQAGASAPGGLINYVVKRPSAQAQRLLKTEITDQGNWLLATDVAHSKSRLNLAHEVLQPHINNSQGSRSLVSFAHNWQFSESSLLEAEVEWSRRSQNSQAAFSLLGNTLPEPATPNLNLNNQSWTQPVIFEGLTGSLRFSRQLNSQWRWSLIAGSQELSTDDRLAYPYGCSAENSYDRYCSDGSFDLYDYRSNNERRSTHGMKTGLAGKFDSGAFQHVLEFGYRGHLSQERFEAQAYNFAGIGNISGTAQVPANPSATDPSTNRDSAVSEIYLFNSTSWQQWRGWLGVQLSDIRRRSIRTDASRPTDIREQFALPWASLSYSFPAVMTYVSYGQGVETYVTPNRSGYNNPGQFVPDVVSTQLEAGLRGMGATSWGLSVFQIERPVVEDQKPLFEIDGKALHQGLEMELHKELGPWKMGSSLMLLRATRQDSTLVPEFNGRRPVNVPEQTLRALVAYRVPHLQGLTFNARVSHEGERAVTARNDIYLPSWIRWDVGTHYQIKNGDKVTDIRLNIDNLMDQKYWKESPTQYGHIYLYPGAVRSITLSLQTNF